MGSRKKTRRYEASRRNGHYTPTQQTPTSSSKDNNPPSITKARRRLQFGRKPPKDRGTIPDTVDETDETIQIKNTTVIEVKLNVTVQETTQTKSSEPEPSSRNKKTKNKGLRLKRELEYLMYDADHEVFPVRLRSTLHSLMNCYKNKKENNKSRNKPQKHNELSPPPSTNRQH